MHDDLPREEQIYSKDWKLTRELLLKAGELSMNDLGVFGGLAVEEMEQLRGMTQTVTRMNRMAGGFGGGRGGGPMAKGAMAMDGAPMAAVPVLHRRGSPTTIRPLTACAY